MEPTGDSTAGEYGVSSIERRSKRELWLLLALLAIGTWPYLEALWQWPVSRDAAVWILRGNPSGDGWLEWVFQTRHFKVAYRPVTALSYSLNAALTGLHTTSYRATDLALHLLVAVLVYRLYRRLAPALPAWGGLVAAGLFLAHPVADAVVPHLARRSYSLATALGLAGLLLVMPRARMKLMPSVLCAAAGGLLLAAALLANETAVLYAAMVPFVVCAGGPLRGRVGRVIVQCATPIALVAIALAARSFVTGGVGGYQFDGAARERIMPIVRSTWSALGALGLSSEQTIGSTIRAAAAAVVGLAYLWLAIIVPLLGPTHPARRACLVAIVWLIGYTVLFAPLGVWFTRQMYPVVVPFALLIAFTLGATFGEGRKHGKLALRLLPQVLLLLWMVAHSPLIRGPDQARAACWRATDGLLRRIHSAAQSVERPACVYLVLPYYPRSVGEPALRARSDQEQSAYGLRAPAEWVAALLDDPSVKLVHQLSFRQIAGAADRQALYERGQRLLRLRAGALIYTARGGTRQHRVRREELIRLDEIPVPRGAGRRYVFVDDGTDSALLTPR